MDLQTLSGLLRLERERQGLSFITVAEKGGFSNESAVRRLEREDTNPTLRSLQRYANALGVKLSFNLERMTILTAFNHAGGVAKTSTVRDLGVTLAQLGAKVLLIDADPQGNLSFGLGVRETTLEQTIYPAIIDELPLPKPLEVHGLHLIPSHLDLMQLEIKIPSIIMGITNLRNAVRKLEGYDLVLIDAPPSLAPIATSAAIAADQLLVPIPTKSKGLESLSTVMNMVSSFRRAAPTLGIALFVVTQFDSRIGHHKMALESIRASLPRIAPVSSPLIYRPSVYDRAQLEGIPVPLLDPRDEAVKRSIEEIMIVATELLERLGVNYGTHAPDQA